MKGKEKCKALKEIRRQIAEKNDIPYAVSQCTYQGECKGTCPKCEAELRYLEQELAIRQSLGKAVALAGISVGVCGTVTGCNPVEAITELFQEAEPLEGDVIEITTTEADIQGMEMEPDDDIEGDTEMDTTEEVLMGEFVSTEVTEEVTELEGDVVITENEE